MGLLDYIFMIIVGIVVIPGIAILIALYTDFFSVLFGTKKEKNSKEPDNLSYLWLARDEDGLVYLYTDKPFKRENQWYLDNACMDIYEQSLPKNCNPKWEDKEPIKVKLTLVE